MIHFQDIFLLRWKNVHCTVQLKTVFLLLYSLIPFDAKIGSNIVDVLLLEFNFNENLHWSTALRYKKCVSSSIFADPF
jgi:hypothetical protein